MNNKFIDFKQVLNFVAESFIPTELIKEIRGWDKIVKSPYGLSFYNDEVGWDYKVDGSFRIADHWNFESRGKLHCQTTTPIKDGKWALGQFNAALGKYEIIKISDALKNKVKDTFVFKYMTMEVSYQKSISNHGHRKLDIDMNYLKRYYKLLEVHKINPKKLIANNFTL